MATTELDDYQWLASDDAEPYLARAAADQRSTVALVTALRKELSPTRVHLVVEQIELRERAKQKFSGADQMFFTRKLLEQATGELAANYKAARFPHHVPTVDLCCGLGGDLLALARRGDSLGIDIDPVSALLADENCRRQGQTSGSARRGDARQAPIEAGMLWHIDPDRRARGTRSIQTEFWEPDAGALRQLLARHTNGAIKLAPATVLPDDFPEEAEREWIGQPRTCRQQIAWFGSLARRPSQHTATILGRHNEVPPASISGLPDQEVPTAQELGRYLHEPHAAVLAGRLTGALAAALDLEAITQGVPYLTSERRLNHDPRLATFELIEALPFDIKQLKAALRVRKIGRLEIKHRGLQLDPDVLRKRLGVPGDNRGTLIVAGGRDQVRAFLTVRCKP